MICTLITFLLDSASIGQGLSYSLSVSVPGYYWESITLLLIRFQINSTLHINYIPLFLLKSIVISFTPSIVVYQPLY